MGLDSVTAWVIVRRYDELDENTEDDLPISAPIAMKLKQNSNFNDLKSQIRSWLSLPENGIVIKLRRMDEKLITLTSLLEGSSEQNPFVMDIARIHQNSPVSPRLAYSPTYIESVRSKINCLEQRVQRVELLVPEFQSRRLATIEQTMQQLSSKVNFLDKRLDELAPVEWKAQFQQSTVTS
ncbi:hypothetical protein R5R35_001942 [Gryllus longicercus]|uniref:Uncharacterized protein n=1 Tax=Gryllus longicercus TaxID=2509291 RepID=A0AAN9VW69_9ORTH